jgi:hypothetical protein
MSKKIVGLDIGSYAFSSASNKIIISGISSLSLKQILLIVNTTAGVVIYDPTKSNLNSSSFGLVSGNYELVLKYVTSGMGNNDELLIFVDSGFLSFYLRDIIGNIINPAKEDGNLASVKTNTDKLDVALSTRWGTLGQKTGANSAPVVIASDQSALPVSQNGAWSHQVRDSTNVLINPAKEDGNLAALLLRAGEVQSSPTQYTILGRLKDIVTQLSTTILVNVTSFLGISLGQKTMNNSFPVVIASDQSSVPVSISNTGSIQLKDSSGNIINPSKEDGNLASIFTILQGANLNNLCYENLSGIGLIRANMWRRGVTYNVPDGYTMRVSKFTSMSSLNTCSSRIVKLKKFGTYNIGTQTFTDDFSYYVPSFACKVIALVTGVLNNAAPNITLTYVNQDGITGRQTGALNIIALSPVESQFEFILQSGDIGIVDVTSVSRNGIATGIIEIWGVTEISMSQNNPAYSYITDNFNDKIIIPAGCSVGLDYTGTVTSSAQRVMKALFTVT